MFDKMKNIMEMKKQADRIKKELDAVIVDVSDVPGIRLTITGAQEFRSLEIEAGLLAPGNKAQLEADLLKSVNAALKKAQGVVAQKVSSTLLTGF